MEKNGMGGACSAYGDAYRVLVGRLERKYTALKT